MKRKWLVIGIILLFVGIYILPTVTASNQEKTIFSSTIKTKPFSGYYSGETELKYYLEENLDCVIGIPAPPPVIWKTAIRLTQDEMNIYSDWTMTKVNVAFSAESVQSEIDIRIYIYEKGTTSIKPGPIIVNDTVAHLDTTGVTTIPLVTPVKLTGHEELWVAVEWYQNVPGPGIYYAWMDTLSGPHVWNKSDFCWMGSSWQQFHNVNPSIEGRWGIGAIIESQEITQLTIGNIKGPIGIKADVQNIGGDNAIDVQWSIAVTGGLLKRVNKIATQTETFLLAGSSLPINIGTFFGFGIITIIISAKADNALEISTTKIAFLVGLFIIGIR
jgi:hypothetical protein